MNLEERGTEGQLLSIVVPVYNEQPNIEKFYMEATKAAATLDMDYELIFVDDGSKDATPLILSRLAQEDEHVRAFLSWLAISGINWPLPVEWTMPAVMQLSPWTVIYSIRRK